MSEEHRYQHQCNADLATRAMLRQEGRGLEQERIIRLLEDECDDGWPTGVKHLKTTLHHLIALIKGEK
jgi:hypothetical protein